jgi:hypothetical protein
MPYEEVEVPMIELPQRVRKEDYIRNPTPMDIIVRRFIDACIQLWTWRPGFLHVSMLHWAQPIPAISASSASRQRLRHAH